jgi:glycosyltransferase involved in cell wall biosynthesis
MKVIIQMPCLNEEDSLPVSLGDLPRQLEGVDQVEWLIVNDGSRDNTAAIAASLGAEVVTLPVNLGYGGAVQTGFRYAVEHYYDLAVVMDADGQHDPASINLLAEAVLNGQADVAVGSRFRGRMAYHQPWVKRVGMRLFAWTVSRITQREVTDPTSGFQALNRDALRFFAYDNYPVDYPDADTLLVLHYAGFRVVEAPVTMRERLGGVSMHSGWKPIYYVFKMWLAISMVVLRAQTRLSARRNEL